MIKSTSRKDICIVVNSRHHTQTVVVFFTILFSISKRILPNTQLTTTKRVYLTQDHIKRLNIVKEKNYQNVTFLLESTYT